MSEFEANLNYTGTDDGEGEAEGEREQRIQDSSLCEGSVASTSTATAPGALGIMGDSSSSGMKRVWPSLKRNKQSLVRQLGALRSRRNKSGKFKSRTQVIDASTKFTIPESLPRPSSVTSG